MSLKLLKLQSMIKLYNEMFRSRLRDEMFRNHYKLKNL
jgi:hypothetical protein